MLFLFWWYIKFLVCCAFLVVFSLVLMFLARQLGDTFVSFFLYYIIAVVTVFLVCHIAIVGGLIYKPFTPALYNKISCIPVFLYRMMGLKFQLINPENLSLDQGAIVVVNHQTNLDTWCMFAVWPYAKSMVPVSKKSIFYIWPFGIGSWVLGCIFIDRKNPEAARTTLNSAVKRAMKTKTKVLMFPEGTRNLNAIKTRKLLPFKKGPFRVAIDCQVPIIPVVISPYYWVNNQYKYYKQGDGMLRVLEPVSTKGMKYENMNDLMIQVETAMQNCYTEMVREIEATLPLNHPYMIMKPTETN